MGLQEFFPALRARADSSRDCSVFDAARRREPALSEHHDLASVLAALDARDTNGFPARHALVRALVREQQHHGGSFWATVLLVAFAPMLRTLRSSIQGEPLPPSDLDQLVFEGFLQALARRPADAPRVSVRLRLDTRRFVLRAIQAEQRRVVNQRALEQRARGDEAFDLFVWKCRPSALDQEECRELEALLRETVEGQLPDAKLELVAATRLRGERLRDLVTRRLPAAPPDEQESEYQRLKRERHRTLAQLRRLLEHRLSPPEGAVALEPWKFCEAS